MSHNPEEIINFSMPFNNLSQYGECHINKKKKYACKVSYLKGEITIRGESHKLEEEICLNTGCQMNALKMGGYMHTSTQGS